MSSKTKWIIIVLVLLILALGVVGIAYITTRKAITGPGGAPSSPPEQGEITSSPKMGRFDLGEFVATSRDEELHYIKIQVEVGYIGNLEQELEERKAELRDAIVTILMKLTIARAKEDYIDKFLHKDIETELNRILGKTTSESRIIKVFIPVFLLN